MAKSQEVQFRGEQNGDTKTIAGKIYQGIIPSPEMMEQYQRIDPQIPIKLLQLVESEAAHRRKIESKVVNHAFLSSLIGNVCGLLAIGGLGFVAFEFMTHRYAAEGMAIALTIAGVVGIFVVRKYKPSKEDKDT